MQKKRFFPGLQIDDFIHPVDKRFLYDNRDKADMIKKGISVLDDAGVVLVREITLGRYVEITEDTCPRVMRILKDVCRILDYYNFPSVYLHHEAEQFVLAVGTEHQQILISEYILDHYDDDMLYFVLGNAITMFKGGHSQINTICTVSGGISCAYPLKLALLAKLRAADLTSDRGGLIACQSFAAAARCILMSMGYPYDELTQLDNERMSAIVEAVINEDNNIFDDMINKASTALVELNMRSSPAKVKLEELYKWYHEGYQELYATGSERYE